MPRNSDTAANVVTKTRGLFGDRCISCSGNRGSGAIVELMALIFRQQLLVPKYEEKVPIGTLGKVQ